MYKIRDIDLFFNGKTLHSTLYRDVSISEIPHPLKRVYLLVQNEQRLYYVVYNSKHDRWGLPGGHIEKGESVQKTAKREFQEEVGLELESLQVKYMIVHYDTIDEFEVICTGTTSGKESKIYLEDETISQVALLTKEQALARLKPVELWQEIFSSNI